jgi:hypothetical protein
VVSRVPFFFFIGRALSSIWTPEALILTASVLWTSAALAFALGWLP